MTTQEEISKIISEEYSDYKGRLLRPLRTVHAELRFLMGDEAFLTYLEQQKEINPRPRYELPSSLEKLSQL